MTLVTRLDARGRDCRERALALWPGLDRSKLRRTKGDPARIARLVERRTRLSYDDILSLLTSRGAERG